ncbi:MAG: ATP-dependent helicase [Desulfarculus sp.]|nr:MAG: ATP-dependent helicase [Desulfarculus sp.]
MEDSFKVLEKYYLSWSGKPSLQYHKEDGAPSCLCHLSSEIYEAQVVASIARKAIQEKKTVLILAPKKDFFPLLMKALTKKKVPYNCTIDLLPKRIAVVKRFIDWVQKTDDSFMTRLICEDLITGGIAHVPGAKKNGRSSEETINNRIAEETNIAQLWESVDKKNDLYSALKNLDNPNKTIKAIQEALLAFEESYVNYASDNKGEFARLLATLSKIWVNPNKIIEDISNVVNIIQTDQPFGSTSAQLLTMRKAKGLEAQVVIIVGLEDDIVPDPRSEDIEEESRLLYVSMTRAKEKLYLLHSFKKPRNISYGNALEHKQKSRFLETIGRNSAWMAPTNKKKTLQQ